MFGPEQCKHSEVSFININKIWAIFWLWWLPLNLFPLFLPLHHPLHPLIPFYFVFFMFLTFRNSIAASAVCAFNLSAISQVFNGPFKYQENSRSAWLPYPNPNPDFQVTKLNRGAWFVVAAVIWFSFVFRDLNSTEAPQTGKQQSQATQEAVPFFKLKANTNMLTCSKWYHASVMPSVTFTFSWAK